MGTINLIGISGKKGAGKDEVGRIIQESTATLHNVWEIKKFADKVKEITCIILGCKKEDLENSLFKETELSKEWKIWFLGDGIGNIFGGLHSTKEEAEENRGICSWILDPEVKSKTYTPREILQKVGTDLFRNQLHPNIWCNALFSDYVPKKNKVSYPKIRHLGTRYDRLDEYHQLTKGTTKEEFLLFLKPLIGKCTDFKKFESSKYAIDKSVGRIDESLHDVVGGFFNKLGYYAQEFYNDWLPEDLQRCWIKDKNLTERRFNWVVEELKNYPDYTENTFPNWVITDVRFPNEAQAIKDRGGIIIKKEFNPNLIQEDIHESETALDDYKNFDAIIRWHDNKQDLMIEVESVLKQFNILK